MQQQVSLISYYFFDSSLISFCFTSANLIAPSIVFRNCFNDSTEACVVSPSLIPIPFVSEPIDQTIRLSIFIANTWIWLPAMFVYSAYAFSFISIFFLCAYSPVGIAFNVGWWNTTFFIYYFIKRTLTDRVHIRFRLSRHDRCLREWNVR